MFSFAQAALHRHEVMEVKSQRDPKVETPTPARSSDGSPALVQAYMGLERMLLAWVSVMGFVVSTSLLLLQSEGTAARVLQYVWLPFAAAGVVFALWRYMGRVNTLQSLQRARVTQEGHLDVAAYSALVALVLATVLSVFTLSMLQ